MTPCGGSGVSGGCWRSPCRWAVDRVAVRSNGDYLWKLAFRRKVAWDIPAMCGVEAAVRRALTRIEHDCLVLEFVAHKVEWRDEIRIAGDYDKSVAGVMVIFR